MWIGPFSGGNTRCARGITHIVAAIQVSQAVRLILGDNHNARGLLYVDAWDFRLESIEVRRPPGGCRVCSDGQKDLGGFRNLRGLVSLEGIDAV